MLRWTAAQLLSRIALEKPLKLTEWPSDMDGQILPAQLKLREAIAQRRITNVRGRLGPPGSKERIPDDLLSDPEFMLLVTPYGSLTVHPPHERHKFEEKYRIDLDNWWREIDFDQDESEQAFSASPAPCQKQLDRPHLRLLGTLLVRSDETEAPARLPAPEAAATPPPNAEAGPEESPSAAQKTAAKPVPVASEELPGRAEAESEPVPPTELSHGEPVPAASEELPGVLKPGGRPTDRDRIVEEARRRLSAEGAKETVPRELASFARSLRRWLQQQPNPVLTNGEVMSVDTIEEHVRGMFREFWRAQENR